MQRSKGNASLKNSQKVVRRKGSAITIDEVAAHAGVSAMTVSRVINGHSSVREENRERVMRSVLAFVGKDPELVRTRKRAMTASTASTASHVESQARSQALSQAAQAAAG